MSTSGMFGHISSIVWTVAEDPGQVKGQEKILCNGIEWKRYLKNESVALLCEKKFKVVA